jgi:phage protein D
MPDQNTTPESKVLINGVELSPEMRVDVLEIKVAQYVEGGDLFQMTMSTLGSDDLDLRWIDSDELAPGNTVEIKLGYRGELETLIRGEITGLHASYPSNEPSQVDVQGFDKLHRLRRGKRTRAFYEIKDSQIAETIAGDLGLSADVEDTRVVHRYLLQNNMSDVDFLLMRARRIRYEVLIAEQTLVFRQAANDLGEVLTLEYQRNLKSFAPRLSTVLQTSEVSVRGWSPASKEAILGVARAGDEISKMAGQEVGPAIADSAFGSTSGSVVRLPVASQAEADQIAKARFNEMAIELISGEGEAVGNPALRAGVTVRFAGLGERFSGLYYVKRAEHRFGPKIGYVTMFTATRNAS